MQSTHELTTLVDLGASGLPRLWTTDFVAESLPADTYRVVNLATGALDATDTSQARMEKSITIGL